MERPSLNILTGFSALQMLLRLYPRRYREDGWLVDRTLRSFVITIIPGASFDDPHLIKMYLDAYYPFSPFTGFFVYDLIRRSRKISGQAEFQRLSPAERTRVVENALSGDETISRLYQGAILMAQVSFYGGIYDPDGRCPLIDLPGRNRGYPQEAVLHPDAEQYLALESTDDGNPP
jgi:hypothetical protein